MNEITTNGVCRLVTVFTRKKKSLKNNNGLRENRETRSHLNYNVKHGIITVSHLCLSSSNCFFFIRPKTIEIVIFFIIEDPKNPCTDGAIVIFFPKKLSTLLHPKRIGSASELCSFGIYVQFSNFFSRLTRIKIYIFHFFDQRFNAFEIRTNFNCKSSTHV